jgi:hypothetical protein
MSLNWSTEKCNPPLPQNDGEQATQFALAFACIGTDLGEIKKSNIDEWLFRIYASKQIGVPMLDIPNEWTVAETRQVLERWIGLSANVITKTRKQWLRRLSAILEEEVMRNLRRSAAEPEDAVNAP